MPRAQKEPVGHVAALVGSVTTPSRRSGRVSDYRDRRCRRKRRGVTERSLEVAPEPVARVWWAGRKNVVS